MEIVGLNEATASVCHRRGNVPQALDQAQAGDNIGTLLRGVDKKEIERGQVLAKPGSIKPHTKFVSEVYVLTKEEGGRHTPFFNGYRPQFYFRDDGRNRGGDPAGRRGKCACPGTTLK